MDLKIYTDGGSRGNPGHSAIGVVLCDISGKVLEDHKKYIGIATNNVAEYQAMIAGLELARKYKPCKVFVHMDSELIVNQMLGRYKVKNENMANYFRIAHSLVPEFEQVVFVSIPREQNKLADKLVNEALNIQEALSGSQK